MNKNKGENVHREPSDSSNRKSRILCGIYSYSRLLRTSFAHPTNQATITYRTDDERAHQTVEIVAKATLRWTKE